MTRKCSTDKNGEVVMIDSLNCEMFCVPMPSVDDGTMVLVLEPEERYNR